MSSSLCQAIVKASGQLKAPCTKPAKYDVDGELLCGTHVGKRKDDKYLIKNKVRAEQSSEEPGVGPEQVSTVLSGLLLRSAVCEIVFEGITLKTLEHAYQMMKFYYRHDDPIINAALIHQVYAITVARDAGEAHKLGQQQKVPWEDKGQEIEVVLPIRPDWNSRAIQGEESGETGIYSTKERFMFDMIKLKFRPGSKAARELLATGDTELIDNSNGGMHWSTGTNGHGRNRHGELLMMMRTMLTES